MEIIVVDNASSDGSPNEVEQRYPHVRLVLELRLEAFVEFTGFIPYRQLWEYLTAADICLDPDPASQ